MKKILINPLFWLVVAALVFVGWAIGQTPYMTTGYLAGVNLSPLVHPGRLVELAVIIAIGFAVARFIPGGSPLVDFLSRRIPGILELAFGRSKNAWLSGERESAARQVWPEDRYPTLYKDIPADIRRPVVWDGKVLGGHSVVHLAWHHMSPAVLVETARQSGRVAKRIGIAVFVSVPLLVLYSGFGGMGREFPTWAQEVGAWQYVAGHYALVAVDFIFSGLGTLLTAAIAAALIFVASWYFAFWRTLKSWWDAASAPLRTPTRDALLFWKAKADIRTSEYRAYCRQVESATGRLAHLPVIPVGVAEGVLRARGDMESPNPGQVVAYDGESIRQHTLVLGGTGEGKTRTVIRPIFRRIMTADWGLDHRIGAYVTDGKGTLWRDLLPSVENRPDVRIIGAGEDHYGVDLLAGMSPLEVSSVFKSVSGQVAGRPSEDFWSEQASLLLMHVAAIARIIHTDKASVGAWKSLRPYSLLGLVKIATDAAAQEAACVRVTEIGEQYDAAGIPQSPELVEAVNSALWIATTWLPMAIETKSGIIANVAVVLGKLSHSGPLAERFFTGTADRIMDVDHALRGGVVMVAVGETEWGMAGKVVACWLKARLFIAARRRLVADPEGCRQTSCAMIADEWQMLVTAGPDSDTSFWNVGRETGVFLVAATQSIAALHQVLGPDQTANLVNLLRSKIVLKTEEVSTIEFIRKIAGEVPRGWESARGFYSTQGAREIAIPDRDPASPKPAWWHGFVPTLPTLAGDSMNAIVAFDQSHTLRGEQAASSQISETLRVEDKSEAALIAGLQYRPKIESDELLLGAGHAFAIIQRAGGDRSDIIDLEALAA